MPRIRLATGVTLDYFDGGKGDGTPMLLVHGWIDSWRTWEAALPGLAGDYRVICVSLRGFGDSEKPDSDYSMSTFVRDLDAFMSAIEVPRAIIVGHSMGGLIVHQLAVEHPQRVTKLVIVGAASTLHGIAALEAQTEHIAQLKDPVDPEYVKTAHVAAMRTEVPASRLACILYESGKASAHALYQSYVGLLEENHADRLKEIKVPTLVVGGEDDIYISVEQQRELAAAIPGAILKLYPNVGHGVQWEIPEQFVPDLVKFLNQ